MHHPLEPRVHPGHSTDPLDRWEGEPVDRLARRWGIPRLQVHDRVGSTSDVARGLAEEGAPAGSCVLAEEQVAGRGRERRSWSSPPFLGVWMSIVLRPGAGHERSALPILLGLATASALDPFCKPLRVQLKWPNDLLLGGLKIGGILCEGSWDGTRPGPVVAGIGFNVLHDPQDFPPELRSVATSIRIQCGWTPPRAEIAGAVARAALAVSSTPILTPELLDELAARDALKGRSILVSGSEDGDFRGMALGIDANGCLCARTGDGSLRRVRTGTVRVDEVAAL